MVVRPKVLARWVPWFFGLGLLVAVAMFATHHSDEMAFAQLVLHARPGWLIVALLLQMGTYVTEARIWQRVLGRAKISKPLRWRMFSGNFGGGLWIAFIGWFLDNAASAQIQQVMFQGLLAGHKVAQAMSSHCVAIPAELTLQQLVDEHILSGGQRCFLVNRGSDTVGLMTLHRIGIVPREEWQTTSAAQAMLPLDKLMRIKSDEELGVALQQMDRDGVNQLPVMTNNQVVGMLSREDVITFLRTVQELAS